jgi:carbohydrate-binding DOMON domain-containing protein
MRKLRWQAAAVAAALGLAVAAATPAATAQKVSFKDPRDDDNGPGKLTYPTDPAYKPGSFDLTGFELKARGDKVDLAVEMASKLDDPWKTGNGFSVQLVFVFIQTRGQAREAGEKPAAGKKGTGKKAGGKAGAGKPEAGKAGAEKPGTGKPAAIKPASAKPAAEPHGFTQGLPGLNVQFAPEDGWDRCIILSPLPASRVRAEVEAKAAAMKDAVVIPARVKGSGHTISAVIDRKALGPGDPTDWGYQVVIASSDAYPAAGSLLVRKVNETESQHRFGGGTDGDCGPNVLDVLAGGGEGKPEEVAAQHQMLQAECNPDGTAKRLATLKMVRLGKEED